MRTQLILTTAALGLVSLGAGAQVYSVNAVGYINLTLAPGGLVMAANQLINADNKLATVIPTAPEGTVVYTYTQAAGYAIAQYELGEWSANPSVAPGVGMFIAAAATPASQQITLVGEVPQGTLTTVLAKGLNLVASQVPQAGKLTTDLKFAPAEGDQAFQWVKASQSYAAYGYELGEWSPAEPVLAVGEGIFISTAANSPSWTRTFSVNQ